MLRGAEECDGGSFCMRRAALAALLLVSPATAYPELG